MINIAMYIVCNTITSFGVYNLFAVVQLRIHPLLHKTKIPCNHHIKSECLFYFFNAFFLKTIVPPLGKMGSISSRQKTPGTDPDVEGAGVLTNTKKDVQGGIEDVTDVKDTVKDLVNDIVNDVVENIGKFVLEVVEYKESSNSKAFNISMQAFKYHRILY